MKEAHYFFVPDAASQHELPQDETQHAVRVLRLKDGDEIFLMDGKGSFFRSHITMASSHHCFYDIDEALPQHRAWEGHIHLAIAPTKMNERMEWLAEKATEIGIDELSFLHCQFSERKVIKQERIDKIVTAAMKQSRKAWRPVVNGMIDFDDFVETHRGDCLYLAHCYPELPRIDFFNELKTRPHAENVIIMIGPEGDFSVEEVRRAESCGCLSITLGESRLRTETAGLAAVMMYQLVHRNQ